MNIIKNLTVAGGLCLALITRTALAQNYLVTDFGAKGDGKTVNTAAIQKAIDKATDKGGGTVIIPNGIFMSGTITLKSNITLQLNRNAVLKGVADASAYPSVPISYRVLSGSGQSGHALIYASKQENIGITGYGTIDGNGADPIFILKKGENVMRPLGLLIESCKNVSISGISMRSSAMWMQRYLACDFLKIEGITVFNHVNDNNDGLDIDDCHDVIVSNCVIDADDDALCFKSEGLRGVKNAVITNCIFATHASAFKMGTGSIGGFQSIQLSNTVIRQSRATNLVHIFKQKSGLTGIDIASVDGALVKDINVNNVSIDSLEAPIFLKLGNRMNRRGEPKDGVFEDVHFNQITIKNAGPITSAITGFPGHYVSNISFRDIFIEHTTGGTIKDTTMKVPENSNQYPGSRMFSKSRLPPSGFYVRHAKGIAFNNIQIRMLAPDPRPALVLDDALDVDISGLKYQPQSNLPAYITVANSRLVNISKSGDDKLVRKINSTDVTVTR